jgi:hypothetical protein
MNNLTCLSMVEFSEGLSLVTMDAGHSGSHVSVEMAT